MFDTMLHLVRFFCMNYVATDLILVKVLTLRNVLILIIAQRVLGVVKRILRLLHTRKVI
jgi:hypothetical protein